MVIMIAVGALVIGLSGGAIAVGLVVRRRAAERDGVMVQQQAAAVDAAVRQVLTEREATTRAVTADREQMVAAAVDQAVKVASATLRATLADGSKELDLRSQRFDERVEAVTGQLDKVQRLVADLQRDKAAQHGKLVEQLEHASLRSRELHETTAALRDALASPKSRGQWGERMAEDVLAACGFREGVNYRRQRAMPSGGVPDFTFLLPRGLVLNMDVKFPIDNYLRFLEATDDLQRDRFRVAFAKDVRSRIKELRDRGYIDPEQTVDSLLLFIPNESVYAFLHENDAELLDIALAHKVVLCSPSTLFSVLAVVRQAVDNFRLERRSSEILELLVDFRSEWGRFTDHLEKAGRQLDTFQKSFESLGGTRRNQLERRFRRIDDLDDERSRAELETAVEGAVVREVTPGTGPRHVALRPAETGNWRGSAAG